MSEEKFDPIKEFTSIRDNLSKMVEQSVRGFAGAQTVRVDVYETTDEIIVRTAPIDGINPANIDVSIENELLTISGTTFPDTDIRAEATPVQIERRFGAFTRVVKLPHLVDQDLARAKFENGRLTITLPKKAPLPSQAHRLELQQDQDE
jgi:HSP20 family protein